jgi:hypothetical protein
VKVEAMGQSIRMTARRAELLRAFSESWRLGAEALEPANSGPKAEAWSLVGVSVLTPTGVDTYTPGPRWNEAVAAAEAFKGAQS